MGSVALVPLRGVLNINKPSGITSYDVIRQLKPMLPGTKLGHAGTLDPLASGVLLVLVGAATKIADYLQQQEKEYRASVRLGVRTDSDDITGKVVESHPVPNYQPDEIVRVLAGFLGGYEQVPPAFSARKQEGERAYRRARAGRPVSLSARPVQIREITLLSVELPSLEFCATVSKGTYLRALVRDIGTRLGCGATLVRLTRERSGDFLLSHAVPLAELSPADLPARLIPLDQALSFLPSLTVRPEAEPRLRHGQVLRAEDIAQPGPFPPGRHRIQDQTRKILAIYQWESGALPRRPRQIRNSESRQDANSAEASQSGQFRPVRGIYADS